MLYKVLLHKHSTKWLPFKIPLEPEGVLVFKYGRYQCKNSLAQLISTYLLTVRGFHQNSSNESTLKGVSL